MAGEEKARYFDHLYRQMRENNCPYYLKRGKLKRKGLRGKLPSFQWEGVKARVVLSSLASVALLGGRLVDHATLFSRELVFGCACPSAGKCDLVGERVAARFLESFGRIAERHCAAAGSGQLEHGDSFHSPPIASSNAGGTSAHAPLAALYRQ